MMITVCRENRSRNTRIGEPLEAFTLPHTAYSRSVFEKAQEKIGCNNFNRLYIHDLLKVTM